MTSIGISAFEGCTSLETVDLSDAAALTSINEAAFKGTALTAITIPATVRVIGASAFENCTRLTVTFADRTNSNVFLTIKEDAFKGTADAPTEIKTGGGFTDNSGTITEVKNAADNATTLAIITAASSPKEVVVKKGGSITVEATSDALTPTYQWQKLYANVWRPISGATTKDLAVSEAGNYRCKVTVTGTGNGTGTTALYHYTTVKMKSNPAPPYIPTYFSVTLHPTEGAITNPKAGKYIKEEGYSFSFRLELEEGYEGSTPVVKANDKVITPRESDGKYIVRNIGEDTDIIIEGVMKDDPTANAEVEGAVKVMAVDGVLHIYLPREEMVSVYTASGLLYKEEKLSGGAHQIALTRGVYIVRVGAESYKVALR